jgi:hypothetical protein
VRAFKLFATAGSQTVDPPAQGVALVGRAATSDVPIYDPTISRRHAELVLASNGVKVRDLGSSNGTFLNGARITEAVAVDGDVVTFGKVAFHVKEVTPAVARPAIDPGAVPGMPPGATIVRRVVAEEPLAAARPSGQLRAEGGSPEERRSRAMALLLEISKELSRHQDVDKLLQKVWTSPSRS